MACGLCSLSPLPRRCGSASQLGGQNLSPTWSGSMGTVLPPGTQCRHYAVIELFTMWDALGPPIPRSAALPGLRHSSSPYVVWLSGRSVPCSRFPHLWLQRLCASLLALMLLPSSAGPALGVNTQLRAQYRPCLASCSKSLGSIEVPTSVINVGLSEEISIRHHLAVATISLGYYSGHQSYRPE